MNAKTIITDLVRDFISRNPGCSKHQVQQHVARLFPVGQRYQPGRNPQVIQRALKTTEAIAALAEDRGTPHKAALYLKEPKQ